MFVEDCAIVESPAMRIFAAAGAAAMAATAADILRTTEETFIFDISGWLGDVQMCWLQRECLGLLCGGLKGSYIKKGSSLDP